MDDFDSKLHCTCGHRKDEDKIGDVCSCVRDINGYSWLSWRVLESVSAQNYPSGRWSAPIDGREVVIGDDTAIFLKNKPRHMSEPRAELLLPRPIGTFLPPDPDVADVLTAYSRFR